MDIVYNPTSCQHVVSLDVTDPALVGLHWVTGEADHLCPTLLKLWHNLCNCTKLRGAYGSVVSRMGEQHTPATRSGFVCVCARKE